MAAVSTATCRRGAAVAVHPHSQGKVSAVTPPNVARREALMDDKAGRIRVGTARDEGGTVSGRRGTAAGKGVSSPGMSWWRPAAVPVLDSSIGAAQAFHIRHAGELFEEPLRCPAVDSLEELTDER